MTVKELKKILDNYPEDYIIYTPCGYCDEMAEAHDIKDYIPTETKWEEDPKSKQLIPAPVFHHDKTGIYLDCY